MLVDVDLDEFDRPVGLLDDFFDRRPELFARPAPRRPEIDDDGRLFGRDQDVLLERVVAGILDQIGRGGGSGFTGADQLVHGGNSFFAEENGESDGSWQAPQISLAFARAVTIIRARFDG